MSKFGDKINVDGFSVENIDISEIEELTDWMPLNGVVDLNIAEQGLVKALHGQSLCQEILIQIDRLIGIKEGEKNKAFGEAYLNKAVNAGHKVVRSREVFSEADDDYIKASNELAIAKAAKKWFENKAAYFLAQHYMHKTFLKRDYSLEQLGNFQAGSVTEEDKSWTLEEPVWDEFDKVR